MEKVTVDYNGEHSALRKNFQDLNTELFKYRNIFKYKFNSNANDRIDIFLEDDFIEKLFEFIERQNELLIVSKIFIL